MSLEMGSPPSTQIIKHLNKNPFPFTTPSASRIWLLVMMGNRTPLLFSNSFVYIPVSLYFQPIGVWYSKYSYYNLYTVVLQYFHLILYIFSLIHNKNSRKPWLKVASHPTNIWSFMKGNFSNSAKIRMTWSSNTKQKAECKIFLMYFHVYAFITKETKL